LVLAQAYEFRAEMDKAAGEVERAEKLAPKNADILLNAAWVCAALARLDHAVELAGRPPRLNPHYPYWYIHGLYYIYFFGKDFETSFDYAKRGTSTVASDLALALASSKRPKYAAVAARKARRTIWNGEPQSDPPSTKSANSGPMYRPGGQCPSSKTTVLNIVRQFDRKPH
jgi:tetratricopeptide (TPR) repeat protein